MSKQFKYKNYNPNKAERNRRLFVQNRFQAMQSGYRDAVIEMAKLGRDSTDGIVREEDRVSNAEMLKIPISNAVIMQRMSTLIDNPSRAIYKTDSQDKSNLDIAIQMRRHDGIEGRYVANYQQQQLTSEREGICVVKQGWHEEFKMIDGEMVTIGKIHTSDEIVRIENFFWDPTSIELRGDGPKVANDAGDRQYMSILDLRVKYGNDDNYKNIDRVQPLNGDNALIYKNIWSDRWEEAILENDGENDVTTPSDTNKEVTLWNYYARNFYDEETGEVCDVYLVYANGVEIRKSRIPVPTLGGKPELPYYKLVSVPTGMFAGLSIPAIIRHPERALQRMVTMADAQAELGVNPIQFMSSSIVEALGDSPLLPGARVEVDMAGRSVADEVYIHRMPDMTNGAMMIIDKMLQFITLISGVDITALFESPKTKAISTERKREIQEKLLRYSVIYNEAHGFHDMEEMKLRIMLENYPVKRYFLDKNEQGEEDVVERYPKIFVDGYEVNVVEGDQKKNDDEKRFKLTKSPTSFSALTVNPAVIDPNIQIYVEGASQAANEETFTLNRNIEKLNVLSTNPYTSKVIDPIKAARQVFKWMNLDENEYFKEELEKSDSALHPAMKEIQALLLKDIMEIPLVLDNDYDAQEFLDVFSNFIKLKEFKGLTDTVQRAILERYDFHLKNSLNPYYKEMLRKQLEAEQMAEAEKASPTAVKAARDAKAPLKERELETRVNEEAGELGKAGKTQTQNSREQRQL